MSHIKPHLSSLQSSDKQCPNCLSIGMYIFHQLKKVPVHSVMNIKTRDAAINFTRGDISLGFCDKCGFISNVDFDASLIGYSEDCEESQGYSETFNAFARNLVENLIEKYGLRDKTIIEIGCGKGEFLELLCDLGNNTGIGFDPAYIPGRGTADGKENLSFIVDYYSEKYARYHGDLVCCRMTLEHIHETYKLIRTVRKSIGQRMETLVFFQVPDVTRILNTCAFEDVYYEHCSYFSPGSLARLFRENGFDILDIQTVYEGQYIVMEAVPIEVDSGRRLTQENDLVPIGQAVLKFQKAYTSTIQYWGERLQEHKSNSRKIVVWGSGSKGVAFLNAVNGSDMIEYVVDINPHRQGTFMAGTGQQIVSPEYLTEYRPDEVIVMNAIYESEIRRDLKRLGLSPALVAL